MSEQDDFAKLYITATQVRARYGSIADMTLWRWLADPSLAFPRPLHINRRRFWRLDELEDWERAQAAKAKAGLEMP